MIDNESGRKQIRDAVRAANELDREAIALGYPSASELHGLRPGYLLRMKRAALLARDDGAIMAIERLEEVVRAMHELHEEQAVLMATLREYESFIGYVQKIREPPMKRIAVGGNGA